MSLPAARIAVVSLILAIAIAADARAALTHDPSLTWRTLKSEHFLVHFHNGEEMLARKAAAVAEQAHARLANQLHWQPWERTEITLTDRMDVPNGFASPIPSNRITVFVTPPDGVDSLEDYDDWLRLVITHEYVHILHMDQARGAPAGLRKIFGRYPLPFPNTFPNAWQPSWFIEGLATYIETDTERGVGRGQSSFFRMLMRTEVAAGVKPVRQVNQPIASWPTGFVPYLYGVEYHNFIAEKKGEDKIIRMVENYSRSFVPYTINTNSKRIFRKNVNRMWDDFARYLGEKYGPELAAIEARGLREGEQLTHDGYHGGPVRVLTDGRVVYVRNDGRSEPQLMLMEPDGKRHALGEVHPGARLHVHPHAGVLVAQPERYRNANYFYDLYRYDLGSGKRNRLTRAGRYHFGAWNPSGDRIIAVNMESGHSSLHLLDAEGKRLEVLSELGSEEVVSELDWAPDGRSIVAALWRPVFGWNLEQFTLDDRQWRQLTHDSAIEAQPRFTADSHAILFTSDHGGVYNIRRLDLATNQIVTLSNVRGGAFYPTIIGDTVYYSGYHAGGFDVYRLHLTEPSLPLPVVALGSSAIAAGEIPMPGDLAVEDYSPWQSMRPRWWFPHLIVEKDRTEIGLQTVGSDTLDRHYYGLDVAYDFSNDSFVGAVDYLYDRWYPMFKAHASRAPDFQRNENGDLVRLRRKDIMQIETVLPAVFYRRSISLHFAALQDRESDDRVASGAGRLFTKRDTKDNLFATALLYDSARRYPLSISRAGGQQLALVAESSDVIAGSDFTGEVYTVDWRGFAGLGSEQVLALRLLGGWGTENPQPFKLGGSDGATYNSALGIVTSTLTANALFDQRNYGLRGYPSGLPQLTGRRMLAATAEYRFPVTRIERGFMVPFPGALDQLHGAVFIDSGATWNEGGAPDEYFTGAGVEALADLILLYDVPIRLRLGYAHGFDRGGEDQVYLRLGASF